MTLRNTIRVYLLSLLNWAKTNQEYWGDINKRYQQTLDEERLLARLRKEAKERKKASLKDGK
jgi:hypothetical protein